MMKIFAKHSIKYFESGRFEFESIIPITATIGANIGVIYSDRFDDDFMKFIPKEIKGLMVGCYVGIALPVVMPIIVLASPALVYNGVFKSKP